MFPTYMWLNKIYCFRETKVMNHCIHFAVFLFYNFLHQALRRTSKITSRSHPQSRRTSTGASTYYEDGHDEPYVIFSKVFVIKEVCFFQCARMFRNLPYFWCWVAWQSILCTFLAFFFLLKRCFFEQSSRYKYVVSKLEE